MYWKSLKIYENHWSLLKCSETDWTPTKVIQIYWHPLKSIGDPLEIFDIYGRSMTLHDNLLKIYQNQLKKPPQNASTSTKPALWKGVWGAFGRRRSLPGTISIPRCVQNRFLKNFTWIWLLFGRPKYTQNQSRMWLLFLIDFGKYYMYCETTSTKLCKFT